MLKVARFPEFPKTMRLLTAVSMLCRNLTIIGSQFTTVSFFISIGFNLPFARAMQLTRCYKKPALTGAGYVSEEFGSLHGAVPAPVVYRYYLQPQGCLSQQVFPQWQQQRQPGQHW